MENPADKNKNSETAGRPCPHPTKEQLQERWTRWHRAMEISHEMLMAGLRRKVGPDGDLKAAYREWYERYQAIKWTPKGTDPKITDSQHDS